MNWALAMLLIVFFEASVYTAGWWQARGGYRLGFRSGYRLGYEDGDRVSWSRLRGGTEPASTAGELGRGSPAAGELGRGSTAGELGHGGAAVRELERADDAGRYGSVLTFGIDQSDATTLVPLAVGTTYTSVASRGQHARE